MSNILTSAARPLVMAPTEKAVLMALADMARDPDDPQAPAQCWPPMHGQDGAVGICDWTCLSERSVQRALKVLAAAKHITARRLSHGQRYTVHPGGTSPVTLAGDTRADRSSPATLTGETGQSPATQSQSPATVSSSPATVTGKASESITKPQKTTSSISRAAAFAAIERLSDLPALPASSSPAQWADYAAMRAEMTRGSKPKPWTAGIARKAIEKLQTLAAAGHDAGAVLDASVLNGWQGLFPVKGDHDGQRPDRVGGRGSASYGRAQSVDGFTAALRAVAATAGGADNDGRS